MKALLNNRFAPLTFKWGFVEGPFAQVSEAFLRWREQLDKNSGVHTESKSFRASLSESLSKLEPLTTPLNRYLLTETRGGWSAIFANGLRGNDVASPVSYLPQILGCRGLEVACTPDRSKTADRDELQIYGTVKFILHGPNETDWLNRIRDISLWNDFSGWEFAAEGEIQPFEQTENYQRRRKVDRFTPEMLESYCGALGIDLFNSDSYGEDCLLLHTMGQRFRGPAMSLAEARSHVHI